MSFEVVPDLQQLPPPLFVIYYDTDNHTDFFTNKEKYEAKHTVLKDKGLNLEHLEMICYDLSRSIEEYRVANYLIPGETYLSIVKVPKETLPLVSWN